MFRDADPQSLPGRCTVLRRRYHLHMPGMVYIATMILLAFGAINSQNNLLFGAFGLAMGGILVSGVVSGAMLMALELRAEPPRDAQAGVPMRVRYTLRNRSRWLPTFGVSIDELAHVRGRARTTWSKHTPQPRAFAPIIPRRGIETIEAFVVPERRGRATFDVVRASTTFPFGIARKSIYFAAPRACLVRPRLLPLRDDLFIRTTGQDERGRRATRAAGAGEEFFGVREYAPGDEERSIAWRPTARTDQLIVRQTTVPTPMRVRIVLELPSAESDSTADETAISLAASLAVRGAARGMSIALNVPATSVTLPFSSGDRATAATLDALASLQLDGLAASNPLDSPTVRRGETVIMVHADDGQWPSTGGIAHLSAAHPEEYLGADVDSGPASSEQTRSGGSWSTRIATFLWGDSE